MKRTLTAIAAIAAMLAANTAHAMPCGDSQALELQGLVSELALVAKSCHDEDQYNDFVRKYQAFLGADDASVNRYFREHFGRSAQSRHDSFITLLANDQSQEALDLGSDFCKRDYALFGEVMALDGPQELRSYAAGKDVLPANAIPECYVHEAAEHRTYHHRKK